eukprot:TRINITY_DN5675_c0_g1_i1.p1 TRINITY_DN5675_c0_g1~~TRINITY_DN5675_c0_g1_i1.p1  ORF type:complete len:259 (-),score=70.55 TRINITY_DN5675_c0_g1_i1:158-823(-)
MAASKGMRAVVLGGTGEIGRYVVRELVQSPRFSRVVSLQRRKVDFHPQDEKLEQVIVANFDELEKPEYAKHFQGMTHAFNAFGTTRADAGGADAFRRIDYGYSSKFGQQCHDAGIKNVHLVTSTGSDKNSFFLYMQVKGQLEELYESFKFKTLSIWRPGLLGRENPRFGEKVALFFMKGMPVSRVAQAMRMRAEDLETNPPATDNLVERLGDSQINKITGN